MPNYSCLTDSGTIDRFSLSDFSHRQAQTDKFKKKNVKFSFISHERLHTDERSMAKKENLTEAHPSALRLIDHIASDSHLFQNDLLGRSYSRESETLSNST